MVLDDNRRGAVIARWFQNKNKEQKTTAGRGSGGRSDE
jgi:hypothetical protein